MKFVKQKLAFNNKTIFGLNFKNSIEDSFCKTSKMFFTGKINLDGRIYEQQPDAFKKSELWAYIYYLYYYNNSDVDIFRRMKSQNNQANAILFYNTVKNTNIEEETVPQITTLQLIQFINMVLDQEDIINPMFDYLHVLLDRKVIPNLSGFELKTGKNSNNFEIVPVNSKNANIKVSFRSANSKVI